MRRPLTTLCLVLCAPLLAACGTAGSTSTSGFTGVKREVAQGIASLQSDAAGVEQKKVCTEDLSASVVKRLGGTKGCQEHPRRQEQAQHLDARQGRPRVEGRRRVAASASCSSLQLPPLVSNSSAP
jgi:hypothetical protein